MGNSAIKRNAERFSRCHGAAASASPIRGCGRGHFWSRSRPLRRLQEATAPESVPTDPSSAPLPSIHGDVPTLPYFGSLLNDLESPGGLYAAPSAPTRSIS